MFASVTADIRGAMGQLGGDYDVGSNGPIYRKWWETSFTRQNTRQRLEPYWEELNLLVTAMDEFHAGRVVEVGGILASRLRMLTFGIERNLTGKSWRMARHFLTYHTKDQSLCADSLVDEVLKIEEKAVRREKKLQLATGRSATDR